LLDISHQAVSKWVRGACLPDIELLIQLSQVSDMKVHVRKNPWYEVLELIKNQISKPSFDTWFKHTTAGFDGTSLIVFSPSSFSTAWLDSRYSTMITKALDSVTHDSTIQIVFRTE
jgi:transcriptional regulator with XRE-family HTH domain